MKFLFVPNPAVAEALYNALRKTSVRSEETGIIVHALDVFEVITRPGVVPQREVKK